MDRVSWAALGRPGPSLDRPATALVIISPDTVPRWERRRFREYWTRPIVVSSDSITARSRPGWREPRRRQMLGLSPDVTADFSILSAAAKSRAPTGSFVKNFGTSARLGEHEHALRGVVALDVQELVPPGRTDGTGVAKFQNFRGPERRSGRQGRAETRTTGREGLNMNRLTKGFAVSAITFIVAGGCATSERAGGTTTTTLPAAGGGQVVVAAPVRGEVQHTIVGKVTGIDRGDSELAVETRDGSKLTLKLPPFALASVREGDVVSLNVTVTPQH